MENNIVSKKIKELRLSNGFSQEYLADESKLNLRTIQRIESGVSIPRGDTLLRLASALKVTPDELLDWSKQEDPGQLLLINLSALSIVFNPFIGIIIPLALWISKRDKIVHADDTGKKILNFQITWLIFLSLAIIAFIVIAITYKGSTTINLVTTENRKIVIATLAFLFFIGFYYVYSIALILINTFRIQKGSPVTYKPSIRFIK